MPSNSRKKEIQEPISLTDHTHNSQLTGKFFCSNQAFNKNHNFIFVHEQALFWYVQKYEGGGLMQKKSLKWSESSFINRDLVKHTPEIGLKFKRNVL